MEKIKKSKIILDETDNGEWQEIIDFTEFTDDGLGIKELIVLLRLERGSDI